MELKAPAQSDPAAAPPHSLAEDAHAILLGSSFAAFGLLLLNAAGISTGGLAGIALVASYLTGWPVGAIFMALNLPFLLLARSRLGWAFTIKSVSTMAALALLSALMPSWVAVGLIRPAFAAVFGGSLIGIAVLSLARHRASVGGIGILALYLQERRGLSAGLIQLVVDVAVVGAAACVLSLERVIWSALSAIALNLVMFAYHRPGRYLGQ